MPRLYAVTFEGVSVSAAQDLVQLNGATGKMCRIKRVWVGATNTTVPTNQQLETRCRFLPATVSNGSGGATPTPQPFDPGDHSASCTAFTNNTSKATTNGTAVILEEHGDNIFAGYDFMFPTPPLIGPSEAFVFELLSTVTGTVNLSGGLWVEEMGG